MLSEICQVKLWVCTPQWQTTVWLTQQLLQQRLMWTLRVARKHWQSAKLTNETESTASRTCTIQSRTIGSQSFNAGMPRTRHCTTTSLSLNPLQPSTPYPRMIFLHLSVMLKIKCSQPTMSPATSKASMVPLVSRLFLDFKATSTLCTQMWA